MTKVSMPELIRELRGITASLLEGRDITFSCDTENAPETFISDKDKVYQILTNLISNAVKFTEHGSINLTIRQAGRKIMFTVTDTGIGIMESDIDRLLEPFTQADSSISKKYHGTGLGLPLSRKLSQLLSGDLAIRSVFGKGTTVEFFIPVIEEDIIDTARIIKTNDHAIDTVKGKSASVLVVDDDYICRKTTHFILGDEYFLYSADNGAMAIEVFNRIHPDIVLLDIMMPDMTGFEVFDRLHRGENAGNSKFIAVTARAMSDEKEQILRYGFDGYISKPVDNTLLHRMIEELLKDKKYP